MNVFIRNLPSNLISLHRVLEEIIKDIQIVEEEEMNEVSTDFVTVDQFASHYYDLITPSSLRKRLRKHRDYFSTHSGFNEDGHIVFCPLKMLEHLERTSRNWKIKTKCQKYLNELEECD